jgi:hypothetical protein
MVRMETVVSGAAKAYAQNLASSDRTVRARIGLMRHATCNTSP